MATFCQMLRGTASEYRTLIYFGLFLVPVLPGLIIIIIIVVVIIIITINLLS